MKPLLKNIRKEKLTTGASLALLLVIAARLLGLKTDEIEGIPIVDVAQAVVEAATAVLLLFARDPKRNKPEETPQNNK